MKNPNDKLFHAVTTFLTIVGLLAVFLLMLSQNAHCQESKPCHFALAPFRCPGEAPAWTLLKSSGYIATSFDVRATNSAILRGASERSFTDRIFFDPYKPSSGRYALALVEQYGYNALLDIGWRHSRSKKEKALMIGARAGLTALSLYYKFHNDSLLK